MVREWGRGWGTGVEVQITFEPTFVEQGKPPWFFDSQPVLELELVRFSQLRVLRFDVCRPSPPLLALGPRCSPWALGWPGP